MTVYVINLNPVTVSTPNITISGLMTDSLNASGFSFLVDLNAAPADLLNWTIQKAIQNWNGGIPSGSTAFKFGTDKAFVANPGNIVSAPYSKLVIIQ